MAAPAPFGGGAECDERLRNPENIQEYPRPRSTGPRTETVPKQNDRPQEAVIQKYNNINYLENSGIYRPHKWQSFLPQWLSIAPIFNEYGTNFPLQHFEDYGTRIFASVRHDYPIFEVFAIRDIRDKSTFAALRMSGASRMEGGGPSKAHDNSLPGHPARPASGTCCFGSAGAPPAHPFSKRFRADAASLRFWVPWFSAPEFRHEVGAGSRFSMISTASCAVSTNRNRSRSSSEMVPASASASQLMTFSQNARPNSRNGTRSIRPV